MDELSLIRKYGPCCAQLVGQIGHGYDLIRAYLYFSTISAKQRSTSRLTCWHIWQCQLGILKSFQYSECLLSNCTSRVTGESVEQRNCSFSLRLRLSSGLVVSLTSASKHLLFKGCYYVSLAKYRSCLF